MILAAAPTPEYRKFWALMAFAGLRYFEARDLKWKDIDDGKITLVGKGGKLATVPVSERLQAELGVPGDADATIVAPGTFANNTTSIRALKAAVAKVGLNPDGANNHKFRHSFASNLIRSGINIKAVQQLMRHDSIDITLNTYSHLLQNDLKDAVNVI
jgi:integrase